MSQAVKEAAVQYLETHRTLHLGTVSSEGQPMVATVSHVSEGLTVYFMADSRTRKVANISRERRVAFSVTEEYGDWMEIRGVQAQGTASRVTDEAEAARVRRIYAAKFPQVADLPVEADMVLFRITPTLVHFIDNTVSFGHRDIIEP